MKESSIASQVAARLLAAHRSAKLLEAGKQAKSDEQVGERLDPNNLAAYEQWLEVLFGNPQHSPLAPHHHDLWRWTWNIKAQVRPNPFAAVWPRGHVKSGNARRAVVALAARGVRNYALYIMETQDQADKAVQNIQALLEREMLGKYYPGLTQRSTGKYGNSKGWRRDRIRTASGFTIDAMGLDSAGRGANVEEQRPNLIVFDDVDGKYDTEKTTLQKIKTIAETILPMGTDDCAILIVQNLIIQTGVVARLCKMRGKIDIDVAPADFLSDIEISGPVPAVTDLEYEQYLAEDGSYKTRITRGVATWQGMNIQACENLINTEGAVAFKVERQNDTGDSADALLSREIISRNRVQVVPELDRVVIAVDPNAGSGRAGIIAKGRATINKLVHTYTLKNYSSQAGEQGEQWGATVLKAVRELNADTVVIEVNQGGDMAAAIIRTSKLFLYEGGVYSGHELAFDQVQEAELILDGAKVPIEKVRASIGKQPRARPVANRHEQGLCHMLGAQQTLEDQWCKWVPGLPSPDELDADVWAEYSLVPDLGTDGKKKQVGG